MFIVRQNILFCWHALDHLQTMLFRKGYKSTRYSPGSGMIGRSDDPKLIVAIHQCAGRSLIVVG